MAAAGPSRPARIRVPGLAIAAVALLVIGVLTLAPTLSTYQAQQREVRDAQQRIAAQQADLRDLTAQRARWSDPAYVRAQAGSRLYYVMPGTTAYRVINSTAGRRASPAPTAQPQDLAWTDALAGSLTAAGTTDAPPAALEGAR